MDSTSGRSSHSCAASTPSFAEASRAPPPRGGDRLLVDRPAGRVHKCLVRSTAAASPSTSLQRSSGPSVTCRPPRRPASARSVFRARSCDRRAPRRRRSCVPRRGGVGGAALPSRAARLDELAHKTSLSDLQCRRDRSGAVDRVEMVANGYFLTLAHRSGWSCAVHARSGDRAVLLRASVCVGVGARRTGSGVHRVPLTH